MQSQLVCSGCRTILQYPSGAADVRCALCDTVSPVLPMGLEMDLMICGCCRTLLMYSRGVSGVRCLCCGTLNNECYSRRSIKSISHSKLWKLPDDTYVSARSFIGQMCYMWIYHKRWNYKWKLIKFN